MQIETISYEEFTKHLSKYIDWVNTGKQLIVENEKNKSFKVVAMNDNEVVELTEEDLIAIEQSKIEIKKGLGVTHNEVMSQARQLCMR